MTLGQRIQQLRVTWGLSQEELGEKIGVSRQTVSKWELDMTFPEISKIVQMSKLFSVTTDSLLVDGISTFEAESEEYHCGVYRSDKAELVETEKFALLLSCNTEKTVLSVKLYVGMGATKQLRAVCERDQQALVTSYAYLTESQQTVSGDSDHAENAERSARLAVLLGEPYEHDGKRTMRRLESFDVDHSRQPLPKVSEAGFAQCLLRWRMADGYFVNEERMHFYLCTGKTEYVFQIQKDRCNIYCGASYNKVFDLGLAGGGQFFRIRNLDDNSKPFCRFYCNFDYQDQALDIPIDQIQLGACVLTNQGHLWCVKRYTDDEIVLQGCGDDEYIYRRHDRRTEIFLP